MPHLDPERLGSAALEAAALGFEHGRHCALDRHRARRLHGAVGEGLLRADAPRLPARGPPVSGRAAAAAPRAAARRGSRLTCRRPARGGPRALALPRHGEPARRAHGTLSGRVPARPGLAGIGARPGRGGLGGGHRGVPARSRPRRLVRGREPGLHRDLDHRLSSRSPTTRRSPRCALLARRQLDLLFADWAQRSVDGYPAGPKSRSYMHWALGSRNTPWVAWAWMAAGIGDARRSGSWTGRRCRQRLCDPRGGLPPARRAAQPARLRDPRAAEHRASPAAATYDTALYSFATPDYILGSAAVGGRLEPRRLGRAGDHGDPLRLRAGVRAALSLEPDAEPDGGPLEELGGPRPDGGRAQCRAGAPGLRSGGGGDRPRLSLAALGAAGA